MTKHRHILRWILATLAAVAACPSVHAQALGDEACEKLAALPLDMTEITSAEVVSAGPRMFKLMLLGGIPWISLPASCRVAGIVRPVPGSEIRFEVWMPTQGWNGKFLGIGGGGLTGIIEYMQLSIALTQGYAAASTDTGHVGNPADGSWALKHPQRVIDYGHRGIHEMTVKGKQIVNAYFNKPAAHAYFSGCSNGGRSALMEAQRYPLDYDGIVVGAPALDVTGTLPAWGWTQQQIRSVPDGMGLDDKLELIEAAALASCDATDGVKDGVIDDPRRCDFRPETLTCRNGDSDDCLTATQVTLLGQLYAGPGPLNGYEHFGLEPGGATGLGGWRDLFDSWYAKSGQYKYVHEFFRYLTYDDATWDFSRFDFSKDRPEMRQRVGSALDATDPDLSGFFARGGKLIMYHGWSDVALPPRTTVHYYEQMRAKMGAAADDAVQFYMVPGMQHCAMGPGPNVFGQLAFGEGQSPQSNVHAALEAWVEKGVKPDRIIAGKYDSDIGAQFRPQGSKLLRTRPLCPYPQTAKWNGQGDSDEAASFSCVTPQSP